MILSCIRCLFVTPSLVDHPIHIGKIRGPLNAEATTGIQNLGPDGNGFKQRKRTPLAKRRYGRENCLIVISGFQNGEPPSGALRHAFAVRQDIRRDLLVREVHVEVERVRTDSD